MNKYLLLAICTILLVSCSTSNQPQQPKELVVYNWENYFAPDTISKFETEYNVKVHLYTFKDEAYMESDVQSNPAKYDVVIASNQLIEEMDSLRLLAEINLSNIPNLKNIAPEFKNLGYDPENKHSVPYMWGTTGIAINTKYIPEDIDSWSVLFDDKYKGKISMLNSKEEVVGAALKYLGYSLKTTNINALESAKEVLLKQKHLLRGYEDPIVIQDSMIAEELWVSQIYSGEGFVASEQNPSIKYIIPKEGASIWVDNLAIPVESQNKRTAEEFINFILRPDVGADIANYVGYATPNEVAKDLVSSELLDDHGIYPSDEVLANLESIGVGDEVVNEYNRIWSELQRKK